MSPLFKKLVYSFVLSAPLATPQLQAISPVEHPSPASHSEKQKIYKEVTDQIRRCRLVVQEHSSNNPKVLKMFDDTLAMWHRYYREKKGHFDIQSLLKALDFAARKHVNQHREDATHTPYIIHPIGVARSLWEEGHVRSINVLVAALLHDTVEDTDATPEEIEKLFGPRVRHTVEELTDDPHLTSEENKQLQVDHGPHLSLNGQLVKLADRLYNIRDLKEPTPSWNHKEIQHYLGWGQKLLSALRGTNENLERLLEKEIHEQLD